MTALRLLVVGEWRRQRRNIPWLLLVVMIGAGSTMFTLAASRRAESSFERFRAATDDGDVFVGTPGEPDRLADVLAMPQVDRAAPFGYVPMWHEDASQEERDNGGAYLSIDGRWLYENLRPIVLDGRMPAPDAGSAMVVNEAFAAAYGVAVGDTVTMEAVTGEALERIEMDVEGITRLSLDLTSNAGGRVAYLPPGFAAAHPDVAVVGGFAMVWLSGGTDASVAYTSSARAVAGDRSGFFSADLTHEAQIVENATSVVATALALIALALGLASLLVTGLLVARSAASNRERVLPLRAAGVTAPQRALAATAPPVAATSIGLALAIIVAAAVSTVRPGGLARAAEPDPSAYWDLTADGIVVVGFLLVAVGAAGVAGMLQWRRRDVRTGFRLARWRRAGEPVAVRLGARFAARVSVGALVGTVLGVAGVVASLTFAERFSSVVDDPGLWGAPFDFLVDVEDPELARVDDVRNVSGVAGVALTRYADLVPVEAAVDAVQIEPFDATLMGFAEVSGPAPVTILEGRLPAAMDEAMLGPSTASRAGVTIGDEIAVPNAADDGTTFLTVVGRALVPVLADGGPTVGLIVTAERFDLIAHSEEIPPTMWVTVADGANPSDVISRVQDLGLSTHSVERPSEMHNLSPVRNHPLLLGTVLGGLGLAAVAGGIVASTRRRRREAAALRAVGLTSGQLISATGWETAFISGVAVAVGTPLGVLVAHQVWNGFADGLFLPSGLDSPWTRAIGVSVLMVLASVTVTLLPARASARRSIGRDLRES